MLFGVRKSFKGNSTDEGQLPRHGEDYSTCENSCLSSLTKSALNDVIRGWRQISNTISELQKNIILKDVDIYQAEERKQKKVLAALWEM